MTAAPGAGAGEPDQREAPQPATSTDAPTPAAPRVELRERMARPFRRRSLTWRLVAVLVVLLVAAFTASTMVTTTLMRHYLKERAVAELKIAAEPLAGQVYVQYLSSDTLVQMPSNYAVALYHLDGTGEVAFYPQDGRYVPALPNLTADDPRVRSAQPFLIPSEDDDGPAWLAVAGRLQNNSGTYVVASSMAGIDSTVSLMSALSVFIGLLITALCVLVGWLGFRRAFRPLRSIEDTAAAIAAGDLTRRVPQRDANDEVASLARSINAMLTQIEASFGVRAASERRMRQFVTDASHELRTPLATVRGYAELYRQGAVTSPEATASAMVRIESEATRMAGLVEDLLTLARMDNRRPMQLASVDLTVVAGDAVQDARARVSDRSIRLLGLDDSGLAPTVLHGDEARLRQVVTNLLANSVQHTPAGSPIEVLVGPRGEHIRLEVRDHGAGIPPEDISRVFERFYRKDPARGRQEQGGHGLGLAIVAAIVASHGGRVGVAPTRGGGATFVVDLPRSAVTPAHLPGDDPDLTDEPDRP